MVDHLVDDPGCPIDLLGDEAQVAFVFNGTGANVVALRAPIDAALGDSRVAAWQRERPGLPQDEFIDDIPFPETQNYVKRILGTAEDYRRLYGAAGQ